MKLKNGYRLTILLQKTKLARNRNGSKKYGTDYIQISAEEFHSLTLGTVYSKRQGMKQYNKAIKAVE